MIKDEDGGGGGLWTDGEGRRHTTPANLVANRINIKTNIAYSFRDRPFMIQIFDDPHPKIGLKTGRQVSKSTSLAADSIIRTEAYAPYTVLLVTPSQDQTRKFSHDRLGPTIETSPAVRARISTNLDNVYEKEFNDGSKIYLSYVKDNPDRVRGITADDLKMDEAQDMILGLVEPVLKESMFTSPHQRIWWSGTPKSMSNGLEQRVWRQSDQREWMVRCHHHGPLPWHQKLTRENVGKTGVVCKKCGRPISTLDGQWVRTSTRTPQGREPEIHGYHLSQIMFPTREQGGFLNWAEFLSDIENPENDEATILNEKFGESADSEERPIREEELRALCTTQPMAREYQASMIGQQTFAGIDWGQGKSATVLAIGQFCPRTPETFDYVFLRKYQGAETDPSFCIPDIIRWLRTFRVARCQGDWGSGFGMNSQIADAMGPDFLTANYWSSSLSGKAVRYNQDMNAYVLNRNVHIARFFNALKRRQMSVKMTWEDFQPCAQDIMHVFRESRRNGDVYFDHRDTEPDDAMHAMIYAWIIGSLVRYGLQGVEVVRGHEHDPARI